jgi:hypothetical protein
MFGNNPYVYSRIVFDSSNLAKYATFCKYWHSIEVATFTNLFLDYDTNHRKGRHTNSSRQCAINYLSSKSSIVVFRPKIFLFLVFGNRRCKFGRRSFNNQRIRLIGNNRNLLGYQFLNISQ